MNKETLIKKASEIKLTGNNIRPMYMDTYNTLCVTLANPTDESVLDLMALHLINLGNVLVNFLSSNELDDLMGKLSKLNMLPIDDSVWERLELIVNALHKNRSTILVAV